MPWSEITDCVADPNQPANLKCLEALYTNVISAIVSLAGLALFIMLVIGGFTYLTAGADAEKAAKAQKTMGWAIGGIVFMILSYIILRVISWIIGTPLYIFEIPYFGPTPTPTPVTP